MELITHIRKPFTVEAIEITEENIDEVAAIIGEVQTDASGNKYILINRKVVPNMTRASVGWYLTKMGDNYRCYSPKIFNEQFAEHEPNTGYFFEEETDDNKELPQVDPELVSNNVFNNVPEDPAVHETTDPVQLVTEAPIEYRRD